MLKVGGITSSFFQLVLEVPSKLTSDTINKGLGVSKILSKESFKLWPRDWSGAIVAVLVLGSSEVNGAAEEGGSKQGTIYPCGA